jgi:hypothetical protein
MSTKQQVTQWVSEDGRLGIEVDAHGVWIRTREDRADMWSAPQQIPAWLVPLGEPGGMRLSFAGDAHETFQAVVDEMVTSMGRRSSVRYMVQITPSDGGAPFDAWLAGAAPSGSEWGDEVQFVRCVTDGEIEPSGRVESCRVDQIHVY